MTASVCAAALIAAGDTAHAADADWLVTAPETITAAQAGVPAGTSAPQLARAAIHRSAGPLKLGRHGGLRLVADRRAPTAGNDGSVRQLRFVQTVGADLDRVDYLACDMAAAVALEAAATPEADLHAVACLGGHLDLVARLGALRAPTLLIVGEQDSDVLRRNLQALERLSCAHRLVTIPGAGHRFRGPGALRAAAAQLCDWFQAPAAEGAYPPSAGAASAK